MAFVPRLLSRKTGHIPSTSLSSKKILLNIRCYRGDSGDMTARPNNDDIGKREAQLLDIAKPKFDEIQAKHVSMPNLKFISKDSFGNLQHGDNTLELDVRRKRLIYRSKQRGWLEVDLLLGTWASENVMTLNMEELDEFESFVNLETIDIYNILTLRVDVPEDLKGGIVDKIQDWAKESPLGKAEPDKYEEVKRKNNLI